jgi:pimeloyl-ACP methyl ester carboxylesterase
MQAGNQILSRAGRGSIAYRRRAGPDGAAGSAEWPGVVFLGGFMSDMTGTKAEWLEGFTHNAGLLYLRFDYSGHGASEGTFTDGTIGGWLGDVLDVLDRLTEGPQVLVGSSMGGWLALLAALKRPERVCGIVGIAAAPDFTEDLIHSELSDDERAALMRDGIIYQPSAYGEAPTPITRALVEEAQAHLLLGGPIAVRCPIHLLHGLADPDVPWRTAIRILERVESTAAAATLIKDGDHRLSRPEDLERLGDAIRTVIEAAA